MQEDHGERLMTHYVGGYWRVPLGTRAVAVCAADGRRAGTMILAEPVDVARALRAARAALPGWAGAGAADLRAAHLAALRAEAARYADTVALPAGSGRTMSRGGAAGAPGAGVPDRRRGVVALVLRGPTRTPRALRAALAVLGSGAALVVVPDGEAGTAPHDLVQIAHLAGLPAGILALLPGDSGTTAALAGDPAVGRVLQIDAGAP